METPKPKMKRYHGPLIHVTVDGVLFRIRLGGFKAFLQRRAGDYDADIMEFGGKLFCIVKYQINTWDDGPGDYARLLQDIEDEEDEQKNKEH